MKKNMADYREFEGRHSSPSPCKKLSICLLFLVILMVAPLGVLLSQTFTPEQKKAECDKIREACQFAWKGYKTYAWGYDALQPISKTGRNWYKVSLLMTPVDAYDTFILMGLKEEAAEAQGIIFEKLNFAVDMEVQLFEVSIRMLGGLLSSYELSHEKKFLDLAKDLGKRLLPAFRTPTGMPYRYVNLVTGETRDPASNPAEIGTYMLEFGKLTQLTGDSVYYKTAKKAAMEVFKRRSPVGLVGTVIDVKTGKWLNTESQIGARIDSYLEYLLKSWLLFGDKDFRDAWVTSQKAISHYLVQPMPYGWFMTRVDMKTGRETRSLYGALDAFCAGLMALAGDLNTAENLQKGNFYMWNRFNLEPEEFDFRKDTVIYGNYPLRPENIESCFYLYRLTKKEQYLNMGQSMINNILYHCRTEVGFAALKNVQTLEKEDDMESFFFAETLKYAYLLFAPESTLDLEKTVFTTEAHPLSVGGRQWAVGSGQ